MLNKEPFSKRHPYISNILITFGVLIVLFIAGMISTVGEVDSKITMLVGFLLIGIVLIIVITNKNRWSYYGFNSLKNLNSEDIINYIPLFILAILPLITGVDKNISISEILYLVVFMLVVAFVEETIFRGIIVRNFLIKGKSHAIIGSSILFSIPHIINTLGGKSLESTIIQILYALIIGVVLSILVIKTKNIILPICYHYINNISVSITYSNDESVLSLIISIVMITIALFYIGYLLYTLKQRFKYNT